MGNTPNCCERDENIDNIIKERKQIFGYSPEDNKIPDDSSFISNQGGDYPIESDQPADFRYEAKYPNLVNREKIIIKNLPPQKIMESDDQEDYTHEINFQERQSEYDMNNTQKRQTMRIKQLFDLCNKNGKPRDCDDFSPEAYTMFYPKNDPYFYIDKEKVCPNNLKVYNKDDINQIQIYQGDLNYEGQRHGIGKCTTPNYVLIGQWKNDKFSGWGRESRNNGDVFEGRYENGLLNGKGIYLNDKNFKYVGEFKNTKRWGKGDLTTDKIHYEGDFYNNKIHGNGRIKFLREGIEYIGTFKFDKIDGYGTFNWKNGDIYEGQVRSGKMHGYGKYKYKNGQVYEGVFSNGDKTSDKMKKYEAWKNNGYGLGVNSQNIQNEELGPQDSLTRKIKRTGFNSQSQFQDNMSNQNFRVESNNQRQFPDNLRSQNIVSTVNDIPLSNGFNRNNQA